MKDKTVIEEYHRREDGMTPKKSNPVDHPHHYNSGSIETIDAIEDWGFGQGFNLGNAIKYISRANHKNSCIEDLKKARWYLDREISRLEKTPTTKPITATAPLQVSETVVAVLDGSDENPVTGLTDIDDDIKLVDVLSQRDAIKDDFKMPQVTSQQIYLINKW